VARPVPDDAGEREFQRLWGPWTVLSPVEARRLFDGFPRPWWISGGWAIEAFTGIGRPHKDIDVTIFRRDVGALREHFRGRFDLWAAGNGMLRPLDDRRPGVPQWSGQVWLREHALAPWVVDVVLNPGGPTRWVFKRDHSVSRRLDDATWVVDGVRYLRPELVLAHKVRLARPVDDDDLEAVLPRLDAAARAWLRSYVETADPAHRWRRRLGNRRAKKKSVRAG